MISRLTLLLSIFLSSITVAQVTERTDARIQEVAATIFQSASKLKWTSPSDFKKYENNKSKSTQELYESIDGFVREASINNVSKLDSDLKILLSNYQGNPEYTGPAFAEQKDLLHGRSVIIAYSISRGGPAINESAVTIRGYRNDKEKLVLSDTTGSEFDGYGMFTKMLPSPITGESWMIAWGPLHGFNGSKNRVRIYAFDGKNFRTIWSPADMMNVTVDVNSSGFSIKRLDEERYYRLRKCPCMIQEDYAVSIQGPQQIKIYHLDGN